MKIYEYGEANAATILIQPVDDHDMAELDAEIKEIKRLTDTDFCLLAMKVDNWNHDLSPWEAPAILGDDAFGDGAKTTLTEILRLCGDNDKRYFLGGYSLAGLFSLWSSYQSDIFAGIAAASPSVWFPGFAEYMRENRSKARKVYLSLGDKEEKTKNPVMAKVGVCIREGYALLCQQGVKSILEWNNGGHFKEPELRTARAFAWILK